jgi:mono/diheme cytochrome c family protein
MRMWRMVLAAQAFAIGAAAQPAPGDPAAGRRLAETQCSACHVIGPGRSGPEIGNGPAFPEIARMPSTTGMSLTAFLRTPHGGMPDIVLTPTQTDDLVAYLLSLRGEASR